MLDSVRRFFELGVDSAEIDRQAAHPGRGPRGLKELGLLRHARSRRATAGIGLTDTGYARVMQEVGGLDPSVAVTLGAHQSIGMKGILLFGTEEQRSRYLPRLATGELVAAFALTEPGAGSDAAAIQTRAELQRRRELRPQRLARSGSPTAASPTSSPCSRARRRAEEGAKPKITAFLVERAWGVKSGPNEHKLGIRGSSTTEVFFEDVRVPAENVLGEAGRGFKVAMEVLNSGRLGLASGCVGLSQARHQDGGRALQGAARVRAAHRRVRPHQGQDRR